jgi:hypothetical protein
MKENKFSDDERKKLEKGGGCTRFWTLICNWIYRFISW